MKHQISASFTLISLDFDPDEITTLSQIPPTKVWRLGELIHPKASIRYKHNGWAIKSQLDEFDESIELEEHVNSVLQQLKPSWQILAELSRRYDAEMSCVIYSKERPAIHFSKDIIMQISELNAEIDVDLYVFPDESA